MDVDIYVCLSQLDQYRMGICVYIFYRMYLLQDGLVRFGEIEQRGVYVEEGV